MKWGGTIFALEVQITAVWCTCVCACAHQRNSVIIIRVLNKLIDLPTCYPLRAGLRLPEGWDGYVAKKKILNHLLKG